MNERIEDIYHIANREKYEDYDLLALRDQCASLEQYVNDIIYKLSENDRAIIETYLDMRNELEFQSIKVALRWGKMHYK